MAARWRDGSADAWRGSGIKEAAAAEEEKGKAVLELQADEVGDEGVAWSIEGGLRLIFALADITSSSWVGSSSACSGCFATDLVI